MRFTHTLAMGWMLPGVAPTGRKVEFALTAVVGFRNGKVRHEHILWDQTAVLCQLGLLDLPVARAGATSAARLLKLTEAFGVC